MKKFIPNISNPFHQITLWALSVHLITALLSEGFLHPDEQYYVLDYTLEKLNMIVNYEKSWEYMSGIRSFVLPWIMYLFILPFKYLGMTNPHSLSTLLRLFSTIFAFSCQLFFLKQLTRKYHFNHPDRLIMVVLLAWPLILMHARTNSENWSTSLLLLGLGLLLSNKNKILIGTLLSLAFFIRFQVLFLIIPLCYFYRKNLSDLIKIISGFTIGGLLLTGVDSYEYGRWISTPLNYFIVNIFEGKVNTFGTSPFYYYALKTLTKLLPLWGLIIIISLIGAIKYIKQCQLYRDFLILITPFFLIHHLIGHKELRFLYPLLPFFLIVFAKLIEEISPRKFKLVIFSGILAYPVLFIPQYKPMIIYRHLYEKKINLIHTFSKQNPFEIKALLPQPFQTVSIDRLTQAEFVFTQNYQELTFIKNYSNCLPQKSTYPWWLIQINPLGLLSKSNIWVIFKCNPPYTTISD